MTPKSTPPPPNPEPPRPIGVPDSLAAPSPYPDPALRGDANPPAARDALGPVQLTISAGGVRRTLLFVIAGLAAVHVAFQIVNYLITPTPWVYRGLFHLDNEASFPTWYSAVALLAASLLLFVVAARKRRLHDRWTRHWFGLAGGFLLLSMDEIVGLHEALNHETAFSWTLIGAPVSLLVFAIYIPFIRQLPDRLRSRLLIAGMAYLTGALLIEYVQTPLAGAGLIDTLAYNLAVVPEEILEMVGVVILIHALIDYLGHDGRITIALRPALPASVEPPVPAIPVPAASTPAPLRPPLERSA